MRLLLALLSLGLLAQAHDVITTKVTWTREISRLVFKNCASCHREGGPAFSLMTYDEARPWAKAIKEEVLARRMPPWNAVKGFGEFAGDRGLTQEQIEIFADWAEGGAPEGEPAYLPPKPRATAPATPSTAGPRITITGTRKLTAPATFRGIQPGTIPPGGAIQIYATKPDGTTEPLLWVQSFNPKYNRPYWFKEEKSFPAGTTLQTSPATATAIFLSK